MTTICGFCPAAGEVWMAADARATHQNFIAPTRRQKIQRVGRWTIGCSGPSVLGRFVAKLSADSLPDLADELWRKLGEEEWKPHEDEGGPPRYSVDLLISDGNSLWVLGGDCSLYEPRDGFVAIGSGQDFAHGAWHALRYNYYALSDRRWAFTPEELLRVTMDAAMAFDAATGGEIDIVRC